MLRVISLSIFLYILTCFVESLEFKKIIVIIIVGDIYENRFYVKRTLKKSRIYRNLDWNNKPQRTWQKKPKSFIIFLLEGVESV